MKNIWIVTGVGVLGLAIVDYWVHNRHQQHVQRVEGSIKKKTENKARTDLPAAVMALAARLGADATSPSEYVQIKQKGNMILKEGSTDAIPFIAEQYMATTFCGFTWHAKSYGGLVDALDYYDGNQGGLQVWLLGIITVAKDVGSASVGQGELLRYLAEIPYNPDAILFNHDLDWTVVDVHTLKVATGSSPMRAEITFTLDESGFIVGMYAPSRAYKKGNATEYHPWRGRMYGYKLLSGKQIPTFAEVGWELPTGYFVYWKGEVVGWE